MKETEKNKDTKVKKDERGWDEPSWYDEFGNPFRPGYEYYKPWIYGK